MYRLTPGNQDMEDVRCSLLWNNISQVTGSWHPTGTVGSQRAIVSREHSEQFGSFLDAIEWLNSQPAGFQAPNFVSFRGRVAVTRPFNLFFTNN